MANGAPGLNPLPLNHPSFHPAWQDIAEDGRPGSGRGRTWVRRRIPMPNGSNRAAPGLLGRRIKNKAPPIGRGLMKIQEIIDTIKLSGYRLHGAKGRYGDAGLGNCLWSFKGHALPVPFIVHQFPEHVLV